MSDADRVVEREFVIGSCGGFTIRGQHNYVVGATGMIDITTRQSLSNGMKGHQVIRSFAEMLSSRKFAEKFPQVGLKEFHITCSEGILCLN